jgi:hypothetical protein
VEFFQTRKERNVSEWKITRLDKAQSRDKAGGIAAVSRSDWVGCVDG